MLMSLPVKGLFRTASAAIVEQWVPAADVETRNVWSMWWRALKGIKSTF